MLFALVSDTLLTLASLAVSKFTPGTAIRYTIPNGIKANIAHKTVLFTTNHMKTIAHRKIEATTIFHASTSLSLFDTSGVIANTIMLAKTTMLLM